MRRPSDVLCYIGAPTTLFKSCPDSVPEARFFYLPLSFLPSACALVLALVSRVCRGRTGHCRIKYIGRNCRVVLVGGMLLKAEQEVPAAPGTRVVLNYNNKVTSGSFNSPMPSVDAKIAALL